MHKCMVIKFCPFIFLVYTCSTNGAYRSIGTIRLKGNAVILGLIVGTGKFGNSSRCCDLRNF
jgi:hypothetical protein